MKTNLMKHKLRAIVYEILGADDRPRSFSFRGLETRVAEILRAADEGWKRREFQEDARFELPQNDPILSVDETTVLKEIYWDMFRENRITFEPDDTTCFTVHSEAPPFN